MMSSPLRGLLLLACAAALPAQAPAGAAPSSQGFETAWEIAPVMQEISAHATRLLTALDKVDAQAWVRKGASETYASQLASSRAQAKALADQAKALAANPDRLSAALEALFRMQGLDTMLPSVEDAMRKYQSPADAQALASLAAEGDISRDRLQHYVVGLATEREQDLQVMDREAQRCRALVTQTSPPQPKGRKR